MNRGPSLGLTGLEQYSVERAGYFVRREALSAHQVEAAASLTGLLTGHVEADLLREPASGDLLDLVRELPVFDTLAAELLRFPHLSWVRFLPAGRRRSGEWMRDVPIDSSLPLTEQMALLHRHAESYALLVPLQRDASLLVMPGSHEGELTAEQRHAIQAQPDSVPGSVRLRLGPGDLLAISSAVLRQFDPQRGVCGDLLALGYARRSP